MVHRLKTTTLLIALLALTSLSSAKEEDEKSKTKEVVKQCLLECQSQRDAYTFERCVLQCKGLDKNEVRR